MQKSACKMDFDNENMLSRLTSGDKKLYRKKKNQKKS